MAGTSQKRWTRAAVAALPLACLCIVLGGAEAGGATAGPTRPNIVVVMTDDQPPGMMRALPSVERLIGDRGARFTDALVSYPLCCPSRATFLTGEYAHNHGSKGNSAQSGGGYPALEEKKRNLAAWLQTAGYETAFIGKWLNGLRTPSTAPPGWDRWNALVGAGGEGLSSFYDYEIFQPNRGPDHYGTRPSDYQTDVLAREYALPLIEEQAATPDPFFLWMALHPPHDGLGRDDAAGRRCSLGAPDQRGGGQSAIPAPRDAKRFLKTPIPKPPSFDERDISDKPKLLARRPSLSAIDREVIRRNYRCGLAALLAVDDAVRAIVAALERTGQLANTVLVFTTDNGALAGEHRIKAGKKSPYEEAIGVPLMISGPTIAAATEPAGPVVNADLAPTLLELAGATMPTELARPIDGRSLVGALQSGVSPAGRAIPIEARDNIRRARHGYKSLSFVGVRTKRYSYVEHRRASAAGKGEAIALPIGAGRTVDRELYDLARDPYQLENAISAGRYRAAREQLELLLDQLEGCSGAECVIEAEVPAPRR